MSESVGGRATDMQGDLALPRVNGELAFDAPWQARAFGIAVALNECGACDWRDFHRRLAAAIAADGVGDAADEYYDRWLDSLERLLVERGILTPAEIDARAAECAYDARADTHG